MRLNKCELCDQAFLESYKEEPQTPIRCDECRENKPRDPEAPPRAMPAPNAPASPRDGTYLST